MSVHSHAKRLRLVGLGVAGIAAACVSSSTPARVGMGADDFTKACAISKVQFVTFAGLRFGECPDKPSEYVLFEGGQATRILDTQGFTAILTDRACEKPDEGCRNDIAQVIAEREADKSSRGARQRQQAQSEQFSRLGSALSGASAGMRGESSGSQSTTSATAGLSCPLKSERVSGFNRLCAYDCLGSAEVTTIAATDLCPIFISR